MLDYFLIGLAVALVYVLSDSYTSYKYPLLVFIWVVICWPLQVLINTCFGLVSIWNELNACLKNPRTWH